MTVDFCPNLCQYEDIISYFTEARKYTGEYMLGIYGSFDTIDFLADAGVCKSYWQTLAWSYKRVYEKFNVFQYSVTRDDIGEKSPKVCSDLCRDMDVAGMWSYDLESIRDEYYIHSYVN